MGAAEPDGQWLPQGQELLVSGCSDWYQHCWPVPAQCELPAPLRAPESPGGCVCV